MGQKKNIPKTEQQKLTEGLGQNNHAPPKGVKGTGVETNATPPNRPIKPKKSKRKRETKAKPAKKTRPNPLEKLRILQFNIAGLKSGVEELTAKLIEKEVHVACLQETRSLRIMYNIPQGTNN